MVNQEISRLFGRIADALEFKEANRFRVLAYRRGAEAVADLDEEVTVLLREKRLTGVPGIGKGLAGDIAEYLSTHRMRAYEEALEGVPESLLDLLTVSGLGTKRLALLHRNLGVTDLWSLREAMEAGRVAEVPGFGPKLVESLRRGVDRFVQNRERMPLGRARILAREVLAELSREVDVTRAVFAGSLRRARETCGDLDLLVPARDGGAVVQAFTRMPMVERVLAAGDTKGSVLVGQGFQVDLRVVPREALGAALCYFTGSKEHNVRLREIAKRAGLKVNEYGVFRGEDRIAGKTEAEVYAALDLPWIPPEMRENRGEIEAAREGRLPRVVEGRDLRGDLHLHTDWSDGTGTLRAMVEAAKERGYKYIAVTDHSAATAYAKGLTLERWREQAAEVAAVRAAVEGIEVLHGMEVDITRDGDLDLPAEARGELDWILAGIHSEFRTDVTARLVRAMEDPHVDAIAHPTGRLIGRRPGYEGLDIDAVLEAAVRTGTALELNATPERMDLPPDLLRRAAERNVQIVIDSDAHSVEGLEAIELGVSLARRAWLTREAILNTRSLRAIRKERRARGAGS